MKNRKPLLIVGTLGLLGAVWAGAVTAKQDAGEAELIPLPANPAATEIEILDVLPFALDQPYTHWWRKEQPEVRSGLLLVLRTDPELIRPRQSYEAVLYVGQQTAERCNAGTSGNLVCLVPAPLLENGRVDLDLAETPIWFGTPELPERVDAATIRRELRLARQNGVGPAPLAKRLKARPFPETLYARNRDELNPTLADLIERYSPTEVDLVKGLRLPLSRPVRQN